MVSWVGRKGINSRLSQITLRICCQFEADVNQVDEICAVLDLVVEVVVPEIVHQIEIDKGHRLLQIYVRHD